MVRTRDEGGGFEYVASELKTQLEKLRIGMRVGAVVDRDGLEGTPDRWPTLRELLRRQGLEVPEDPPPDGYVTDGPRDGSRIGVWLMPDNTRPGDLEHFLEEALGADRRLWAFASQATQESTQQGASFLPKDLRKAQFHAWLAWQDAPGGGYGLALKRKHLRHDVPLAERFVAWFERLFLVA